MSNAAPRICQGCQTSNPPQAAFCFGCGQPLQQVIAYTPEILHQRYQLVRKLGAGGFGSVYLAEDIQLGRRAVAVKEMRSQSNLSFQENMEVSEAFRQEALLLADLMHPNLPRIHDHFSEAGNWYLVMDYIEGENLEEYLAKQPGGYVPLTEALNIGLQLCSVLDYLHNRQPPIIFRDLKPLNIMRTSNGHLYLIDFGIARHFKPGQARDTMAFGSPGYAAPEQYGRTQTTPRSDIYSLGATLHQTLTGIDPSLQPFQFAALRLPGSLPTPQPLATLLARMVEIEEGKRPASMALVRRELESIAARVATGGFAAGPVGDEDEDDIPALPTSSYGMLRCKHHGLQTIHTLAWSPDGTFMVSAGRGNAIDIWNASSGQTVRSDQVHKGNIRALAWSPDGQYIASASEDRTVQVWEAATGQTLQIYRGHTHLVTDLAWSRDSHYVASASVDKTVQIWEIQTGQVAIHYHRHSDMVYRLSWSPDGKYMVSGGYGGLVHVWEAATGRHLFTYGGHNAMISALAWTPDSQHVISGGSGGSIQVWNAFTGRLMTSYSGHRGYINHLSCASRSGRVVSCGSDCTVQVWDAEHGRQLFTYKGHNPPLSPGFFKHMALPGTPVQQQSEVFAVAWSPDEHWIASGGSDNSIHVWQAE